MNEVLLEQGREAASRGEWPQAYDSLRQADARGDMGRTDLALLARVAYATGHLDVTIETWERTYAECIRAGDRLEAAGAATRVAMHLLFDTALLAPVRGWIKRAALLLEDQELSPVHAWLAVVRNYERMFSGDFLDAQGWARQAIELGTQCDPGAAAIGRIAEARSFVLGGEVSRGLELLDEAAMATASGELDPLWTGIVYCELVCALQGLAQYDLAEEWTLAMERWRHGQPVGSLHGRCRVHRAEILRLRGSYVEAENEALQACQELRPYLRREFGWPLTELGQIRLRKGDLPGAEAAFLEAQQVGWDPQPGIALSYLARGDVGLAAASIRHALEHPSTVPSKELPPNTDLRRAPLLDAQVEIAIEAGDLDRARWAAKELEKIASAFGSRALTASAAAAAGKLRLAEGDPAGALDAFENAIRHWSEIGAPYETALARLGLARSHVAADNAECAQLEFQTARAVFQQVGALREAERAANASMELAADRAGAAEPRSLRPTAAEKRPVDHGVDPQVRAFRREGDHWALVFAGRTVRVRDMKGMRYLARLFAEPGREFHALDLVALERGWSSDLGGTTGLQLSSAWVEEGAPMLDTAAKDAYRRRLAEIEEDIQEARITGDLEREERADAERDFVVRELSRAVGLGGRDRHFGAQSERARASVTRAIRSALSRIRAHDAQLTAHLDDSIRTGTYCAYIPRGPLPVASKR